ncbi:hypothetical protein BT69DRAFT_1293896 [Atractiella rhizophila]|nr:hypothetical protein BT69DRAFT_1293896 [Atractiella rhizophila]
MSRNRIPLDQDALLAFTLAHGKAKGMATPDSLVKGKGRMGASKMRGSGKHLTLDKVEGELDRSFRFGASPSPSSGLKHSKLSGNEQKSGIPRRVRARVDSDKKEKEKEKASKEASTSKIVIHHPYQEASLSPPSPSKKLKKPQPPPPTNTNPQLASPQSPPKTRIPALFSFQRKTKPALSPLNLRQPHPRELQGEPSTPQTPTHQTVPLSYVQSTPQSHNAHPSPSRMTSHFDYPPTPRSSLFSHPQTSPQPQPQQPEHSSARTPKLSKPSFLARQRSRLFASSSLSPTKKGPHVSSEPTTPEKLVKANNATRKARSGVDYGNGLPTPVTPFVLRPKKTPEREVGDRNAITNGTGRREERVSTPAKVEKGKVSTGTTRSLRRIGESIKKRLRSGSSPLEGRRGSLQRHQDEEEEEEEEDGPVSPIPSWREKRKSRIPLPAKFRRASSSAQSQARDSRVHGHSRGQSISSVHSRVSQVSSDLELELELSKRRRPGSKELPTIARDENGFFISPASVRASFAPSKLSTTLHTDADSQLFAQSELQLEKEMEEESMSFTAVMPRSIAHANPNPLSQVKDEETVMLRQREVSTTPASSPLSTLEKRRRLRGKEKGETTQMLDDLIDAVVNVEPEEDEVASVEEEEAGRSDHEFEGSMDMSLSIRNSSSFERPERPTASLLSVGDKMLRQIDSSISLSRAVDSPSKQSRRDFAVLHRRAADDSIDDFTSWSFHPSRSASASLAEKERKGSPLRFYDAGDADIFPSHLKEKRFCDSPLKIRTPDLDFEGESDDMSQLAGARTLNSREVTPDFDRDLSPPFEDSYDDREVSPLDPEDVSAVLAEASHNVSREGSPEVDDLFYREERETSPGSASLSQPPHSPTERSQDDREFSPDVDDVFETFDGASPALSSHLQRSNGFLSSLPPSDRELSPEFESDARHFGEREFSPESPSDFDHDGYLASRELSPESPAQSPSPDLGKRYDAREVSPAESLGQLLRPTFLDPIGPLLGLREQSPSEDYSDFPIRKSSKAVDASVDFSIHIKDSSKEDKSGFYFESTRPIMQLDDVDTGLLSRFDNPPTATLELSSIPRVENSAENNVPTTPDKERHPFGNLRARSRDLVGTSAKRLRPRKREKGSYKKQVLKEVIHEDVERVSWQQRSFDFSKSIRKNNDSDPFSLTGIMDDLADEEREHEKKLKWIHFERAAWREIVQSRNDWPDTAKSVVAVIGFDPPRKALLVLEFLEDSRARFQALVHKPTKVQSPFKHWRKSSTPDPTPVKGMFSFTPQQTPTKEQPPSPSPAPWGSEASLFAKQLDELSFASPSSVKKVRVKKRMDLTPSSSRSISRINALTSISSPEKEKELSHFTALPARLAPRILSKRTPAPQTSFEDSLGPILAGNMTKSRREALEDAVARLEGKDGSLKLKQRDRGSSPETEGPTDFSLEGHGQLVNISPIRRRVRKRPPIRRSQLQ